MGWTKDGLEKGYARQADRSIAGKCMAGVLGLRNEILAGNMEFGVLFTSHPNPKEEPYPHRDVHARTTDEILEAYNRAREPKRLKILRGGHCDLYCCKRGEATQAALEFFKEVL